MSKPVRIKPRVVINALVVDAMVKRLVRLNVVKCYVTMSSSSRPGKYKYMYTDVCGDQTQHLHTVLFPPRPVIYIYIELESVVERLIITGDYEPTAPPLCRVITKREEGGASDAQVSGSISFREIRPLRPPPPFLPVNITQPNYPLFHSPSSSMCRDSRETDIRRGVGGITGRSGGN